MHLVLSLLACSSGPADGPDGTAPDPSTDGPAEAIRSAETPPIGRPINELGVALYSHVVQKEGAKDVFFSPASLEIALAMAAAGADGKTRAEMEAVLHLPKVRAHEALGGLAASWNTGEGAPYKLALANRIWAQDGLTLTPEFEKTSTDLYGAPVERIDFKTLGGAAAKPINTWVEKQTNDKIVDLVPASALGSDTKAVLVNAIYFQGNWETPFDAQLTRDWNFVRADGTKGPMKLMKTLRHLRYHQASTYDVVLLPYKGEALDFLVAVPREPDGLAALEAELSAESIDGWVESARKQEVELGLPRLELEWSQELSGPLGDLGMPLAFTEGADFSRLSTDFPLQISKVMHKAFIAMDEKGTEAAAATAVISTTESVPPRVHCDRPFFFAIRDRTSGALLFMGRVTEPPG